MEMVLWVMDILAMVFLVAWSVRRDNIRKSNERSNPR